MPDDHSELLNDILKRIGQHGETLARHEAEIKSLRDGQERFEALLGELRADVKEWRGELREDMTERFDRLSSQVDALGEQATRLVSPQLAEDLAATRAAESRARAYALALLAALVTTLGAVIALLVH